MSKINSLLVPNRLKILKILQKDSTCVCEIVEKLKLKHNLVSHHLKT
ncbi:ArsR family transcriptional regulator, partial [Candidatus Dojkabacteria bacterium]|nr:ArsR family transcriptional regulator [Candidatus Dojkabacteria bacterium]